eukprot:356781-Chlamydomonas_euryale.AAC.3
MYESTLCPSPPAFQHAAPNRSSLCDWCKKDGLRHARCMGACMYSALTTRGVAMRVCLSAAGRVIMLYHVVASCGRNVEESHCENVPMSAS